jgi:cytidylate kinase
MKTSTPTIPVITIDGDSGSGKGTLAHRLAHHLGFHYLDSGAIYRIVALAAQKNHWLELPEDEFNQKISALKIEFLKAQQAGQYLAYCDEMDVSDFIRTPDIASLASQLSARPSLREVLLVTQKNFAQSPGLVTDGRDMGTVVFKDAVVKFYLTADLDIRAKRRFQQLKDMPNDVSLADVEKRINERDQRDKSRKVAPLVAAADALVIDSTLLSVDEVFQIALAHIALKNPFSA